MKRDRSSLPVEARATIGADEVTNEVRNEVRNVVRNSVSVETVVATIGAYGVATIGADEVQESADEEEVEVLEDRPVCTAYYTCYGII